MRWRAAPHGRPEGMLLPKQRSKLYPWRMTFWRRGERENSSRQFSVIRHFPAVELLPAADGADVACRLFAAP